MENPESVDQIAEEMKRKLIPNESRVEYEKVYMDFKEWRTTKNIVTTNENVLLNYISELEKNYAITTIKKKLSIIKTMLRIEEKVETGSYIQMQAYINKGLAGHVPKKAEAFTVQNYMQFLNDATDDEYLDVKVRKYIYIFFFLILF